MSGVEWEDMKEGGREREERLKTKTVRDSDGEREKVGRRKVETC